MKEEVKYFVKWLGNEGGNNMPLVSTYPNYEYEKSFKTLAEAEAFFADELKEDNGMIPFSKLDFSPTNDECRVHEQSLCICKVITDEDGDTTCDDIIKESDLFWREEY